LYHDAATGYQKTLDLGNYELNTWLSRGDILIQLGELQTAILNFKEALDFHAESAELEYRLAGLHFALKEHEKGMCYLKKALNRDEEYAFIIEELFPKVSKDLVAKNLIKHTQK